MERLHIAFIACNQNAARFRSNSSFIYRCENVAAALEAMGHRVTLVHLSKVALHSRFDVAVFHRPVESIRFRLVLAVLRRRGAVVVADVDDLVFDPDLTEFNPGVLNGIVSFRSVLTLYRAHNRALARFERILVSTQPLAEHARRVFPDAMVRVIPNAVYRGWRTLPDPIRMADAPILTYLPGTRSHDRDFAQVGASVAEFLVRYPEARLYVTGPLALNIKARPGQIVHRDKVPFGDFHMHACAGWVNLAPLEITPFTHCKSALKVLEAGYWNVPTVCTPVADCTRFATAGAVGVERCSDWFSALESLLNSERYKNLTDNLRARVMQRANVDEFAQQFLGVVDSARVSR